MLPRALKGSKYSPVSIATRQAFPTLALILPNMGGKDRCRCPCANQSRLLDSELRDRGVAVDFEPLNKAPERLGSDMSYLKKQVTDVQYCRIDWDAQGKSRASNIPLPELTATSSMKKLLASLPHPCWRNGAG